MAQLTRDSTLPTWLLSALVTATLGLGLLTYNAIIKRLDIIELQIRELNSQQTRALALKEEELKSIYWWLYKLERGLDR